MAQSTARSRRRFAGEGSVYQNGDRWRGAVTWTEPDGTQQRRVVSARTSAEAREKLDKLRRDLSLGTLAPLGSSVTVGEYLAGWIERHRANVRPSTWQTANGYVRVHLIPALGPRPLARLSATDVENALASFVREGRPIRPGDDRPRAISPLSARHVRAVLRRALTDAVRFGIVPRNVAWRDVHDGSHVAKQPFGCC